MVSLKARLCAWMDGQVRESVHVYATCEVGESESPVAEGDGLSPYYVSTAGARRQNRHRSSSTLGPSGIQTPLYYDSVDRQSLKRLKDRLDVEVYRLNGPDFEHEIEMAFLNNLETPLKLAFVGGEEAKQFDGQYR